MNSLLIAENIGIIAAAFSGFFFGVKRGCDLLGLFLSAFLTALGGGLLRDVFVSRLPFSFTHYSPVMLVLGVLFFGIVFRFYRTNLDRIENSTWFIFCDALGIVSFSIVGAGVAYAAGLNAVGVVLVGFFNGIGGGLLRDIILNEVPWFLKTGLYGSVCLLTSFGYFWLLKFGFDGILEVSVLLFFMTAFRMAAFKFGWRLLVLKTKE